MLICFNNVSGAGLQNTHRISAFLIELPKHFFRGELIDMHAILTVLVVFGLGCRTLERNPTDSATRQQGVSAILSGGDEHMLRALSVPRGAKCKTSHLEIEISPSYPSCPPPGSEYCIAPQWLKATMKGSGADWDHKEFLVFLQAMYPKASGQSGAGASSFEALTIVSSDAVPAVQSGKKVPSLVLERRAGTDGYNIFVNGVQVEQDACAVEFAAVEPAGGYSSQCLSNTSL
jgi:hypothetical protein